MGHDHAPHRHARRPPLAAGVGSGGWLFLDCPSGIAGDMTLAALIDLGVPVAEVEQALATLPVGGYELAVGRADRSGIAATTVEIRLDRLPQQHRAFADIDAMLDESPLAAAPKRAARRVFRRLAEAEAAVHGVEVEAVTFHEVGAVDSIVDIVGSAVAITYLGAELMASPLPLGRGLIHAQHGVLPLPAPATVHCLKGVPTYGVDLDQELVTPTGAALVGALAHRFITWPSFAPMAVGYGAGARDLPDRPNVLRAVLGRPTAEIHGTDYQLLEANVDDLTGELAAHAIGALLDAGAVDAWATPLVMKKGRPGLRLAALVSGHLADAVIRSFFRETTTIGVRRIAVGRAERPRATDTVDTKFGAIPIKVSSGFDVASQVKPEFDACVEAARRHGVPVREVIAEAMAVYRAQRPDDPA